MIDLFLKIFSPDNYQWKLSLITVATLFVVTWVGKHLLLLVPEFKKINQLNQEVAAQRLTRDYYPPIQKRSMFWGGVMQLIIFGLIVPFSVTAEPQPWWQVLLDVFVILMFYDFFYYFTHRFVFHDGGFGPGPLMWVHSIHHQQHNPCRLDSSYLHPIETMIGTGLYGASIAVLAWLMGDFHVVTLVVTFIAFAEINQHNHNRIEIDRFPFKYLKYASYMHHVHHKRFDSGNYATITLFYDWLFGTYDSGKGWRKKKPKPPQVVKKAEGFSEAA